MMPEEHQVNNNCQATISKVEDKEVANIEFNMAGDESCAGHQITFFI